MEEICDNSSRWNVEEEFIIVPAISIPILRVEKNDFLNYFLSHCCYYSNFKGWKISYFRHQHAFQFIKVFSHSLVIYVFISCNETPPCCTERERRNFIVSDKTSSFPPFSYVISSVLHLLTSRTLTTHNSQSLGAAGGCVHTQS